MTELTLRADADAAFRAIEKLLPDATHRRCVAEALAASIRHIHSRAPSSWVLTATRPPLRLNVGQIAVMDVESDGLLLYTTAGTPPHNAAYRRVPDHNYKAVKVQTEKWCIPFDETAKLSKELWNRHLELVKVAWQAKRVSPFKRAHAPGALAAIAALAGRNLPQPAHAAPSASEQDAVENGPDVEGALFGSPEKNREVEQAAVRLAIRRLSSKGWHVRSVEREGCGYDLHCTRRGKVLHVEVKGVRGTPTQFVLTPREAKRAETDPNFALVLIGHALDADATYEQWSGCDLLRTFVLEPLRYIARRGTPDRQAMPMSSLNERSPFTKI